MVIQAGQGVADRIVGIHSDFGSGGASERLFPKVGPVYLLPPERAGLDDIESAIQVCGRVRFRWVIAGGLAERDHSGRNDRESNSPHRLCFRFERTV